MPVIKQKTISVGNQKQRIGLKKTGGNGNTQYTIVDLDTGGRIEDPFTSKARATTEFNQSARDIERGMEAEVDDVGGLGDLGTSVFEAETDDAFEGGEDLDELGGETLFDPFEDS